MIFSKYGCILAVKNISGETLAAAFRKLLSDVLRRPKKLRVDKGKKSYNKHFKDALGKTKSKIKMYSTAIILKSVVCER